MIRLTIAALILIVCSGCASKQKEVHQPPPNTIAVGTVADVHWPAQWGNHKYHMGDGDIVSGRYGWYRPPGSAAAYHFKDDYNVIIIKKPISHAATYIVFDPVTVDPKGVQKLLGRIEGELSNVDFNEGALQPGDMVFITIEDYYGANKVGLDFRRGEYNEPLANVTFLNRYRTFRTDPEDPVAPYIPFVSEIE